MWMAGNREGVQKGERAVAPKMKGCRRVLCEGGAERGGDCADCKIKSRKCSQVPRNRGAQALMARLPWYRRPSTGGWEGEAVSAVQAATGISSGDSVQTSTELRLDSLSSGSATSILGTSQSEPPDCLPFLLGWFSVVQRLSEPPQDPCDSCVPQGFLFQRPGVRPGDIFKSSHYEENHDHTAFLDGFAHSWL